MTLIDAPRSHMAFLIPTFPILQEIANIPLSLHLVGSSLLITAVTTSPTLTFSLSASFLLFVQSSFRNFAYFGICLTASRRGMLISTFLKVSRISFSSFSFCVLSNLFGKGGECESSHSDQACAQEVVQIVMERLQAALVLTQGVSLAQLPSLAHD